jgi:hypothetical protein
VRAHRAGLARADGAGGHAISLAAEARLGLAGAIAQCPYGGAPPVRWTPALLATIAWGLLDYVRQALGAAPVYVPTVAEPGGVGVMTVPGWKADMFALADEPRCVLVGPTRVGAC